MRLMTFRNTTFHSGINCTVRKGTYWSCLRDGEKIALVRSLNKSHAYDRIEATVWFTKTMLYRELKSEDIAAEHAPHCQGNIKELLKDMKEIHKIHGGFHANELVTIVYFNV